MRASVETPRLKQAERCPRLRLAAARARSADMARIAAARARLARSRSSGSWRRCSARSAGSRAASTSWARAPGRCSTGCGRSPRRCMPARIRRRPTARRAEPPPISRSDRGVPRLRGVVRERARQPFLQVFERYMPPHAGGRVLDDEDRFRAVARPRSSPIPGRSRSSSCWCASPATRSLP